MTKYFTFQEGSSHKFWQIEVVENKQTVSFGRVGSSGTVKEKVFESVELCMADSLKLIREKQKKGYAEAQDSLKVEDSDDPNLKIGQYLKAHFNSYKAKFLGLKDVHPTFMEIYKALDKFDITAYKTKVSLEIKTNLKEWWTNPSRDIDPNEVVYSILFEYDYFYRKDVTAEAYGIVVFEGFKSYTKNFNMEYDYDFTAGFYAMPGITLNFFDELEKIDLDENSEGYNGSGIGYEEILKIYALHGFFILHEVFAELGQKGIFKAINAKKGFMFMIGEHDMGEVFPIYTLTA